jgi:hypothetical protein
MLLRKKNLICGEDTPCSHVRLIKINTLMNCSLSLFRFYVYSSLGHFCAHKFHCTAIHGIVNHLEQMVVGKLRLEARTAVKASAMWWYGSCINALWN